MLMSPCYRKKTGGKHMRKQNGFVYCSYLILCLISFQTLAQIEIIAEDEYFSNGEIRPFKDAIEGTESIRPEELAYLNAVDVTRTINRWYFRIFFGNPRVKLEEIGNKSPDVFMGLEPGETDVTKYLYTLTFAGGKIWNQWALELELYFMKEMKFNIDPPFIGVAGTSEVKINQAAAFVNVQYIIPRLFSWYPKRLQIHLDGGIGGALKQGDLTVTVFDITPNTPSMGTSSGSTRTVAPAANLGVGFRYQMTASWLFDLAYRYFFFGKTEIGPAVVAVTDPVTFETTYATVEYESNKTQVNGFFIGAVYQI